MGWRARSGFGQWPGRGPFSDLPPWQRPGWMFGFGRGFGRGLGRGFGRGFGLGGNPYVCARFPWLPRGWWANPGIYGPPSYGYGYPEYGHPSYGYPYATYQQYSYPRY